MAELKEFIPYRTGDKLTAKMINDTIETAIHANDTAVGANSQSAAAYSEAAAAVVEAASAKNESANALSKINTAKDDADEALAKANEAITKSIEAINTANGIKQDADDGKFNGFTAMTVESSGIFGFQIVNDELMLSYADGNEPDMKINEAGELIINL